MNLHSFVNPYNDPCFLFSFILAWICLYSFIVVCICSLVSIVVQIPFRLDHICFHSSFVLCYSCLYFIGRAVAVIITASVCLRCLLS